MNVVVAHPCPLGELLSYFKWFGACVCGSRLTFHLCALLSLGASFCRIACAAAFALVLRRARHCSHRWCSVASTVSCLPNSLCLGLLSGSWPELCVFFFANLALFSATVQITFDTTQHRNSRCLPTDTLLYSFVFVDVVRVVVLFLDAM